MGDVDYKPQAPFCRILTVGIKIIFPTCPPRWKLGLKVIRSVGSNPNASQLVDQSITHLLTIY